MRREIVLPTAFGALLCAMLAVGVWFALTPASLAALLPPGATMTRVEQVGGERQRIAVRLSDRQNRYDVYDHLIKSGWSRRRFGVIREDSDYIYTRSSLRGYVYEMALVVQADDARHTLTILYQRCLRRVTCGIR
jgi:uncharacterized protein (DUF58 family)